MEPATTEPRRRPRPPAHPATVVRAALRHRWVQVTALLWVVASVALLTLGGDGLPVQRAGAALSAATEVVNGLGNLVIALVIIGVVLGVTRNRPVVDLAARVPDRATAIAETAGLLAYAAVVTVGGLLIGRAAGEHAISLHLPGTIHGLHGDTLPVGWVALWAGYNLLFWAVIPYLAFRARGYGHDRLGLRSQDRRGDLVLILVVLVVESAVELALVSGELFALTPAQLAVGVPLAFVVNMAGTVLPIMVFVYAILLPRFARITGSTVSTVILGGVAYAVIHLFESWAVFDTLAAGAVTVVLLFFQYFGPGLIKSVLTVRTGNAWVHVWAYHAVAPHVTLDTVTMLDSLELR
ncbi:MAG TPA: hypothetical protein VD813_09520 [Pseudonocardia sp.]|nr:hypothetical protein [Pseudonocardia sp.]